MTQYRVRETKINVHPLIRSIPPARKFIAEKTVRFFFIRMWQQIDGPLWYDTAEEAWAAVRRDAEPRADDTSRPVERGVGPAGGPTPPESDPPGDDPCRPPRD